MTAPHPPGTWLVGWPPTMDGSRHLGRVKAAYVLRDEPLGSEAGLAQSVVHRVHPLGPGEAADPDRIVYEMDLTSWRRPGDYWPHRCASPVESRADLLPVLASPLAHVRELAMRAAADMDQP